MKCLFRQGVLILLEIALMIKVEGAFGAEGDAQGHGLHVLAGEHAERVGEGEVVLRGKGCHARGGREGFLPGGWGWWEDGRSLSDFAKGFEG